MPLLTDILFLRAGVCLILGIISYLALSRTPLKKMSPVISIIIALIAFYYSSVETDAWNLLVFSNSGFLISSAVSLLMMAAIILSIPYSSARRIVWAVYGSIIVFIPISLGLDIPDFFPIVFIIIIALAMIFDKWLYKNLYLLTFRRKSR